jgi:hypothetical protein
MAPPAQHRRPLSSHSNLLLSDKHTPRMHVLPFPVDGFDTEAKYAAYRFLTARW